MSKLIITLVLISFAFCLIACSGYKTPDSIKITKEKIKFTIEDNNYHSVYLGTNIRNIWDLIPMVKKDSVWYAELNNPHKNVEYKFFIDNFLWKTDPLNSLKKKVPPPYKGYNSLLIVR